MFLTWPLWRLCFCTHTENWLSAVTGCSQAYCSKAGSPAAPRALWLAFCSQVPRAGPLGWARATQGTRLLRSSSLCSRHFTDLPISPAWYIWHFLKGRTIGTEIKSVVIRQDLTSLSLKKKKKNPALEIFQDNVNVFNYDRRLYMVAQQLEHNTDDHEHSSLYSACLESTEPWVQSQCTCLYNPMALVGRKDSQKFKTTTSYMVSSRVVWPASNPLPRPNVPLC